MRKKLSTSIYTFSDIIEDNCMYIDKTKDLYNLLIQPKGQFFLSRPRRFGKSMTLSALESIFTGKKELFKGLYIYDKEYDWKKYPIIQLALNRMGSSDAPELEENLCIELNDIAGKYGFVLETKRSYQMFKELIKKLHNKHAKVVVLIDEYDKPILDNVEKLEECQKIRTLLKKFYGQIKACEEHLRFSFLTGVSKFTQVSVFSDLNNLTDLTMDVKFAGICGFTQEECEHYFAEWIIENADTLGISRQEYLDKLKEMYNGIRFSKKDLLLYNPVSFTKAMMNSDFENYWFETGTPTFLLKLLKKMDFEIINLEALITSSDSFSSYEIDNLKIEPLLFQTGYLTIKDYNPDSELYNLSFPNKEVKQSFIKYLTEYFTSVPREEAPNLIEKIRTAFYADDLDKVFELANRFFVKIEYDIKLKHEKYYQSVFYCLFSLLGYRIQTEIKTNDGRMDAVIKSDTHIYIIEFKLDKSAEIAIKQIKENRYYKKYEGDNRQIVLNGVNFTSKKGEIESWIKET